MKFKNSIFLIILFGIRYPILAEKILADDVIQYTVDLKSQNIQFYYKDEKGNQIQSIQNLKSYLESKNKTLVFAMNGGMFKIDGSPVGLYIENFKRINPINKSSGYGNFFLKPNGMFYITKDKKAYVTKNENFKYNKNIEFATQSGPMLVIENIIHSKFTSKSNNLNIRNGVGILADGKILFAMSKKKVNLFQFAKFFQDKGCKNALYIDGAISKTYLPAKNWSQLDGEFGVLIGEIQNQN